MYGKIAAGGFNIIDDDAIDDRHDGCKLRPDLSVPYVIGMD